MSVRLIQHVASFLGVEDLSDDERDLALEAVSLVASGSVKPPSPPQPEMKKGSAYRRAYMAALNPNKAAAH
jgi:hypothetical protein